MSSCCSFTVAWIAGAVVTALAAILSSHLCYLERHLVRSETDYEGLDGSGGL